MADKRFDVRRVGHLGERRNGVPNLGLMGRMQFQKLLNGFSGSVDGVHERI